MATLADVARRAGVSTATASRIINNSPKPVAEALRERVMAAVAELQFVPNAHAQQLARADRSAVGVIVHDVSDPYFAEITRGLQRVATDHGRLVIICNSYRDPERELAYVELLHAHQVAAIVLAGSGYHDAPVTAKLESRLRIYEQTGGRVAVIGRHEHAGDAIVPANEHGGYLAGDALYRLGHTAIGVIAGPRHLTTTTDRLAGLRRAAREHGRRLVDQAHRVRRLRPQRRRGRRRRAPRQQPGPDRDRRAQRLDGDRRAGVPAHARHRRARRRQHHRLRRHADLGDVTPALSTVRLPLVDIGARAHTIALGTHPRGVRGSSGDGTSSSYASSSGGRGGPAQER